MRLESLYQHFVDYSSPFYHHGSYPFPKKVLQFKVDCRLRDIKKEKIAFTSVTITKKNEEEESTDLVVRETNQNLLTIQIDFLVTQYPKELSYDFYEESLKEEERRICQHLNDRFTTFRQKTANVFLSSYSKLLKDGTITYRCSPSLLKDFVRFSLLNYVFKELNQS